MGRKKRARLAAQKAAAEAAARSHSKDSVAGAIVKAPLYIASGATWFGLAAGGHILGHVTRVSGFATAGHKLGEEFHKNASKALDDWHI